MLFLKLFKRSRVEETNGLKNSVKIKEKMESDNLMRRGSLESEQAFLAGLQAYNSTR